MKKFFFNLQLDYKKIMLQNISSMSEDLNINNLENKESNLKTDDRDYKNLIERLKSIKKTIAILEKIIFR